MLSAALLRWMAGLAVARGSGWAGRLLPLQLLLLLPTFLLLQSLLLLPVHWGGAAERRRRRCCRLLAR